jgi:acetyl esterase/lipase
MVTIGKKTPYALLVRLFRLFLTALLTMSGPAFGQSVTLLLWPKGVPEVMSTTGPERDITTTTDPLIAGRRIIKLTDVSLPTLALFKPVHADTGAAVLVLPGGGYSILAYDLEGTEVCGWLNSIGVNCVLVKYRVPVQGHYPENLADLEDAQRAMRLTRQHAAEWKIDPHRIGVLGFSAGGHLAVVLSIHAGQTTYAPTDAADSLDARPDFAVVIYPGYLAQPPELTQLTHGVEPDAHTPPTFLVQAQDDDTAHVENALVYFQALKQAKVPAELHIFAQGGHGYGLRPTDLPVTRWPALAETWFHTIHFLGPTAK